jgi:nucleoside-diphosphate-sugar epimerase
MVSNVLVTGSNGMLGSHVAARFLADGHHVAGLDITQDPATAGVRHVTGDVRDRAVVELAMRDADIVIHCVAGLPSYPTAQIHSITVEGTRTVFEAAQRLAVRRVVHISSTAVYGLPDLVPTPETYPYAPVDAYSTAKAEAEQVAVRLREDAGLVVPILRPKTFVGPGRMGLFSMLFEWAHDGHNFPVLGSGNARIQMLAIEDLVAAVHLASFAPAEIANMTFNVAATEFGTIRDDFQAVLDEAGHGKRIVSIPAAPALFALRTLGHMGLSPVYDRLLHKLRGDSFVATERIQRVLGFSPAYSNREMILRAFRWWRQQPRGRRAAGSGRTSRDPWRQGALALAKAVF